MSDQGSELVAARINIAKLNTEVEFLKAAVEEFKAGQAATDLKLDAVLTQLSEAKGGWRTLMLIGGASATMGGLMVSLISHLPKG